MTIEIKVLNKYHDRVEIAAAKANYNISVVDIARGSVLGNPYVMRDKTDAERDRVIAQYRLWLWGHMKRRTTPGGFIYALASLKTTIYLVCCCKPRKCHGDVIKAAIEWVREQSNCKMINEQNPIQIAQEFRARMNAAENIQDLEIITREMLTDKVLYYSDFSLVDGLTALYYEKEQQLIN